MFCCVSQSPNEAGRMLPLSEALADEINQQCCRANEIDETDLAIAANLSSRIPSTIVDAHTHLGTFSQIEAIPEWLLGHIISTALVWPADVAEKFQQRVLPATKIRSVRFPVPIAGINFDTAVEYVRASCEASGDYWITFGHSTRRESVHREIANPACRGLKCYHRSYNPPSTNIYEFFLPEFLEVCSAASKPIILHLPDSILNLERDLSELARSFPRLPIVLAHCGMMEVFSTDVAEALARVSKFDNVYCDTSMIMDVDVLNFILQNFSPKRVLFGSDLPLAAYRAAYRKNKNGRYVLFPKNDYSWIREKPSSHLADADYVPLFYLMVGNLADVIEENFENSDSVKEAVFCNNSINLFGR